MKKYRILKLIGDGSFGSVCRAQHVETGEIVAIKKMKKKFSSWPECLKLREVQCLINMRSGNFCHENVIQLKSIFREFNELHFVFEYMEGDLYQLMMKQKKTGKYFTEDKIRDLMLQTFRGLGYIHKKGYFHRDMKPENLLMKSDGKGGHSIKIADFGLAREIRSRPPFTDYVSTRWYRAPEVLLKSNNYSYPIDMFAMGVIMAELYTLRPLFPGKSETDELFKLCSTLGTPDEKEWGEGFRLAQKTGFKFPKFIQTPLDQLIKNASPEAIQLMQDLMCWNPRHRPNCQQAMNYPFFTKHQSNIEKNSIFNEITTSSSLVNSKPSNEQSGGGSRSTRGSSKKKKTKKLSNLEQYVGEKDKDLSSHLIQGNSIMKAIQRQKVFENERNEQKSVYKEGRSSPKNRKSVSPRRMVKKKYGSKGSKEFVSYNSSREYISSLYGSGELRKSKSKGSKEFQRHRSKGSGDFGKNIMKKTSSKTKLVNRGGLDSSFSRSRSKGSFDKGLGLEISNSSSYVKSQIGGKKLSYGKIGEKKYSYGKMSPGSIYSKPSFVTKKPSYGDLSYSRGKYGSKKSPIIIDSKKYQKTKPLIKQMGTGDKKYSNKYGYGYMKNPSHRKHNALLTYGDSKKSYKSNIISQFKNSPTKNIMSGFKPTSMLPSAQKYSGGYMGKMSNNMKMY